MDRIAIQSLITKRNERLIHVVIKASITVKLIGGDGAEAYVKSALKAAADGAVFTAMGDSLAAIAVSVGIFDPLYKDTAIIAARVESDTIEELKFLLHNEPSEV